MTPRGVSSPSATTRIVVWTCPDCPADAVPLGSSTVPAAANTASTANRIGRRVFMTRYLHDWSSQVKDTKLCR
jgi:hypothetical protein